MGGRGAPSPKLARRVAAVYISPPPIPEDLVIERNYSIVGFATNELGGAIYPFLEQTGRAWNVITRAITAAENYHPLDTFGLAQPTLRWVNGANVVDVFVDGMTTEDFLAATGLQLSMDKGGFVLSKRLSRVLRPHFVTGLYPAEAVRVRYLDDLDDDGKKVWDGAGVISRAMLERLVIPDGVSAAKRSRLQRELRQAQRVEFTLMTENGQDKGHAIVADDLDVDFVLPRDTKREVKLVNGQRFVGINFVHGHPDMRLDIQSLINLHPFFEQEQLTRWLADEGALFTRSIETGEVGEAMSRLDRHTSLEELEAWPLREYLASGGHPMWFGSHVKSLANQHLERLNRAVLAKMRLPIPGGRYYVMPAAVGRAAGAKLDVPRGGIQIDPRYSTAWVNDQDWLELDDSPDGTGIAGILGGADNDDALWVHPFTDYDGERKVLAWRSPNQGGEYVILKPTPHSDPLAWAAPDSSVSYPPGDSRKLMPRTDRVQVEYLNLIDPSTAGGLGEGHPYSVETMQPTMERAQANGAALGAYCNNLMLAKALYGGLPAHPPAPLEEVIDGSVKLGTDLSPVLDWTRQAAQKILEQRQPIPAILQDRLGPVASGTPAPVTSANHWLDRLVSAVQTHITTLETRRDELVNAAMPPRTVFDSAFEEPETIAIGAGLNRTYTTVLKQIQQRKSGALTPEDYWIARDKAQDYLGQYPPERHTAILRGAMVSIYMSDEPGSDSVLWLAGYKTSDGRYTPGMAQLTMKALREIGVLQEITADAGSGVVTYPGAVIQEPKYRTVGINGVWFNHYRNQLEAAGRSVPDKMADVDQGDKRRLKAHIAQLAQSTFRHLPLSIQSQGSRKVAYTADGKLFGYISKDSADVVGDEITLAYAVAQDGNLRGVIA